MQKHLYSYMHLSCTKQIGMLAFLLLEKSCYLEKKLTFLMNTQTVKGFPLNSFTAFYYSVFLVLQIVMYLHSNGSCPHIESIS